MGNSKVTPWYPAKIKPVYRGLYQVKGCQGYMDCGGYHYWNGRDWTYRGMILRDDHPWRGLTKCE